MNWKLNDDLEVVRVRLAQNVRTFASSGTSGPFSTTAAGFAAIRDVIEPETSTNYETGLRFRGDTFEGLFAVYHVDFKDRLLGITAGTRHRRQSFGARQCRQREDQGRRSRLHVAAGGEPHAGSPRWRATTPSTRTTTSPRTRSGVQTVVPVKGKQVVDTPELLLKSELGYDNGTLLRARRCQLHGRSLLHLSQRRRRGLVHAC